MCNLVAIVRIIVLYNKTIIIILYCIILYYIIRPLFESGSRIAPPALNWSFLGLPGAYILGICYHARCLQCWGGTQDSMHVDRPAEPHPQPCPYSPLGKTKAHLVSFFLKIISGLECTLLTSWLASLLPLIPIHASAAKNDVFLFLFLYSPSLKQSLLFP